MTDEKARRREFGDTLSGLVGGRKSGVVECAWLEESSHRVTHCWKLTSTSPGKEIRIASRPSKRLVSIQPCQQQTSRLRLRDSPYHGLYPRYRNSHSCSPRC